MGNIFSLGWYNHKSSARVLRNCNRLAVCGPFWAPFLLILDLALEIHPTLLLRLDRSLAFLSAFDKLGSYPSLAHNSNMSAHCGPLIYRNCRIIVVAFAQNFVANENDQLHVF